MVGGVCKYVDFEGEGEVPECDPCNCSCDELEVTR